MPGPASTIGCDGPLASQSFTVLSKLLEARCSRPGLNATELMRSVCPLNVCTAGPSRCPRVSQSHRTRPRQHGGRRDHGQGHDRRGVSRKLARSRPVPASQIRTNLSEPPETSRAAVRAKGQTKDLHVGTRQRGVQFAGLRLSQSLIVPRRPRRLAGRPG